MTEQLKIGDIVRLRTGGPLFVVTSITTTPAGTVMVGCALLEQPDVRPIDVRSERLLRLN